jgi:O-acetyl-ADP-ribose deacetylase (regulator of RNase III)
VLLPECAPGSSERRGAVSGIAAISAGTFGWDPDEVARIAVATVRGSSHLHDLDLVRFVLFSSTTYEVFVAALR